VGHLLEPAASGRASCRGCGERIERGLVRFGERLPNPFGDGEMTLWFHPPCAAFKRPEPLLEALAGSELELPERAELEASARAALAHRRLPRIDGAERAKSGRAACRSCREPIARGEWRVKLSYHEDGRWTPGGTIHASCCATYFEGHDAVPAVLRFTAGLDEAARAELRAACAPG